jgi:hypothetical protein
MEKKKVDVGVGKKPAASESSGCYERKIPGLVWSGRTDDDFVPEALNDGIDQRGSTCDRRAAFTSHGEFLLNGNGFSNV